jgi:hypothetical protein
MYFYELTKALKTHPVYSASVTFKTTTVDSHMDLTLSENNLGI